MGRRLRFIPDRTLVEVTAKTLQGRFLLKPSAGLREIFVGILARAADRYDAEVHAFVCLSNHYHLLVSPANVHHLAAFMCYVNTNLSKEAGRLHRWRGPLLHRRFQAILNQRRGGGSGGSPALPARPRLQGRARRQAR